MDRVLRMLTWDRLGQSVITDTDSAKVVGDVYPTVSGSTATLAELVPTGMVAPTVLPALLITDTESVKELMT
jgi:glyceraldehyde-3-phosphate dehydrogenase/erythrose-4-phosphate dehydrogenase